MTELLSNSCTEHATWVMVIEKV